MSAQFPQAAPGAHGGPSENALEENRRLRRTMRDLVALSTLPAIWRGLGSDGIAGSLSDVLLHTLSLDLVYVRLAQRVGKGLIEALRSKHGDPARNEAAKAALASLFLTQRGEPPETIPDPFGSGTLRVAVVRFGVGDDQGVLVACSANADFPTEQDRLLLGVGANQTAIVVQRRQIEEEVHEQREWLRVTLESIGDAVIATDTEGRITFLNSAAQELTGWTAQDAQDKPLATVFHIVNEATRQRVDNPVDEARRECRSVGMANPAMLIAKDGTERPIDDSAAPIRDAAGRMLGVVMVFRAVTEQRRREQRRNARLAVTQALTQSLTVADATQAILQAVCENLDWDAGFFWLADDRDARLKCEAHWHKPEIPLATFTADTCNRTFASGAGLPGRVWASRTPVWIPNVSRDPNFHRLASAAQDGLQSAFACPVIIGNRVLGVIEFFTQASREPDADLLEMMSTMAGNVGQFIERKTAEDELRIRVDQLAQADRRKDEFLATLAHELRNPLAPLRNALEILKMPRVDATMIQQTRAMMERQVHHLVRLVDDLLDVSRVMRGKIELRKEPMELATVVARAVETVQPLVEMQGHRLELSLPDESLRVDADPVRLSQVIGNLLTNSVKYTEAGGHIWVGATRDRDEVVLRVRDDGIGIAPDMLPHIFELFVQADHTSTKAQGGLGVGLTLARNLTQMHGGSIEAHSAGLGKGCEFVVRLPLMVSQPDGCIDRAAEERQHEAPVSGHRLLIVDDNQDAARSLAMLLRLRGHEVRIAHDGAAALAIAASYLPKVVFLDIGMPGMDGYEVARRLRQRPGLESVVLAALTGWGQQEDRRRTTEAGFDHHLVKPADAKALEDLLDALQ